MGDDMSKDVWPEWRDIANAPKDGTQIIACDRRVDGWRVIVSWQPGDENTHRGIFGWRTEDGLGYMDLSLTDWMPVPPMPA